MVQETDDYILMVIQITFWIQEFLASFISALMGNMGYVGLLAEACAL